jgi:hypothetical protein
MPQQARSQIEFGNEKNLIYTVPMLSHSAHFDGPRILLDLPVNLQVGQRLMVTVLDEGDDNHGLYRLAARGLAAAYITSEPIYTEADLRP